jgi:hypothetical protein
MNVQALADLKGELITSPEIVGDPDKIFPVEEKLQLKVGAQVMFVKTIYHSKKTISMVKWALLNRSLVKKSLVHFPEENKTIEVNTEWQNIRYKVDALRVEERFWELLCIIPSS